MQEKCVGDGVQRCVSRVEKEECYYDAIGALYNSADEIADASIVQKEESSCHFTTKVLYFNLEKQYAVSSAALRFEPMNTPFLEIQTTKRFKPIDIVRKAAEEQTSISKDIAAG